MAKILDKNTIEKIINKATHKELVTCVEKAFTEYSCNNAVVPPAGSLSFDDPPGDMHIKYGYIKHDTNYVVKIASGFYKNPTIGLSSSYGLNLVFNQKTGFLETILLDEGILTNTRTALAGVIAAKYLAPKDVKLIGIIGSGIQARLQLKYLKGIVNCRKVIVWGIDKNELQSYKEEMSKEGFDIEIASDSKRIAQACNLIVTTTPSNSAIIFAKDLQKGTHITAVGADTKGKQELDTAIIKNANHIVVDSFKQCCEFGEIHKAVNAGLLDKHKIIELGDVILSGGIQRKDDDITVADLTGIATQDVQISNFILDQLNNQSKN